MRVTYASKGGETVIVLAKREVTVLTEAAGILRAIGRNTHGTAAALETDDAADVLDEAAKAYGQPEAAKPAAKADKG